MTAEANDGAAKDRMQDSAARWTATGPADMEPTDRVSTESAGTESAGTESTPRVDDEHEPGAGTAAVAGAAYGVLLVLGVLVGIYGSFYYAMSLAGVPLGALVAVFVNFLMCRAAGRAMRTRLGALLPAIGWLVTVVVFSSERSEGDLLITGTVSGYIFLFGGIIAAAIAVGMSFAYPSGPHGERPGER